MNDDLIKSIPAILWFLIRIIAVLLLPFILSWFSDTGVSGIVAFFLAFIAILIFLSVLKSQKSTNWPVVEGTITNNEYVEHKRQTGSVKITYSYNFKGKEYSNDRLSFSETSHVLSVVQRIRDKYPIGSKVKVFYNPGNPEESALEPGASGSSYAFVVLIGVGALIAFFFAFKNYEGISNERIIEIKQLINWKK